jgi:O-antigen/teichoic acid export membrane protein
MLRRTQHLLRRKFVQDTLALQVGKLGTTFLSGLAALLLWRLMGPTSYGVYVVAGSFFALWQTLDITGIGVLTGTRLAMAIGARDQTEILNLMAVYVQITLLFTIGLTLLVVLLGQPLAAAMHGDGQIGLLSAGLAVANTADALYGLVIIALQSRRSMKTLAVFQNVNQLILTASLVVAVLIRPTPESLVIGRLVYSYSTMALALYAYTRLRTMGDVSYPPLRAIFARARTVSPRPYWRFGAANGIDKNLSNLFLQLPIQIVSALMGTRAVGYLDLAMSAIGYGSILTSAVFDNMAAVVPQAVGRGDFAGLRRNFLRVLLVLLVGSAVLFGALALFAPFVIPPLLGEEWERAIPALMSLAVYGAVTTVGGIFGPLYRALNLVGWAAAAKVTALVLVLPLGYTLLQSASGIAQVNQAEVGALIGAWMINGLYLISVVLTAVFTLRVLRRKT